MPYFKKLLFAPFFLLAFVILISQLTSLLSSYDFIFSLSFDTLIQLLKISTLLTLAGFLFALFATFANTPKIILPLICLAALSPLFFIKISLSLVLIVAIIISLLLTYLALESALKSYLTFAPSALIGPSVRRFTTLIIISFSIVYFLSSSRLIAENGFQIPDSLIDTALKMTPLPAEQTSAVSTQLPNIPSQQLEILKKNPGLLKQFGLDPKILDTLPAKAAAPQELAGDLLKQTLKDQIQNLVKPYMSFVPAVLALLLFLTLISLASILNLFIYPLLWLIFFILEKTGFVKFEVEQRPVKKLVV